MFTFLRALAIVLFITGVFSSLTTYRFIRSALEITGTVSPSDEYKGPPRSPRAIPFNVSFRIPNSEEDTIVSLPSPVLMPVPEGKEVPLLINPMQTHEVRLNIISELWAFPGGLLLGSLFLFGLSTAALKVRSVSETSGDAA